MNTREIYAHTLDGRPSCVWEPLYGPGSHAERTAAEMAAFRVPFASAVCNPIHARYLMRLLALTHDMGKASADFQAYLLRGGGAKVDHKSAAVKWWQKNSKLFGTLMSYVCFGHHGGLNHPNINWNINLPLPPADAQGSHNGLPLLSDQSEVACVGLLDLLDLDLIPVVGRRHLNSVVDSVPVSSVARVV